MPQNQAATPSLPANHERPTPVWFVLVASGIAGFVFFLMELVWYRMLGPLLGGSVFTFGLILAVALAGIGMGGLWYASAMRDRPATLRVFTWTCLLEAAAIALPFALGDRIALLALVLRPLARIGFAAQVGSWAIVTVARGPAGGRCRGLPVSLAHRALRSRARTTSDNRSAPSTRRTRSAQSRDRSREASVCFRGCPHPAPGASARWRLSRSASRRSGCRGSEALGAPSERRSRSQSSCRCASWRRVPPPSGVTAASVRDGHKPPSRRGISCANGPVRFSAPSCGTKTAPKAASRSRSSPPATPSSSTARAMAAPARDAGTQVMLGLARRHPEPRRATVPGDRPGHRQHRRMAGCGADDGPRGCGRARALDCRYRARVRRSQPRRPAQPQGSHHDRRCARGAAHRARPLRPHRLGAVEPVSCWRRKPVHAGVLPGRQPAADGRRPLSAVGAALRNRRADAQDGLRHARIGLSATSKPGRPAAAISCWLARSGRSCTAPMCSRAAFRRNRSRAR